VSARDYSLSSARTSSFNSSMPRSVGTRWPFRRRSNPCSTKPPLRTRRDATGLVDEYNRPRASRPKNPGQSAPLLTIHTDGCNRMPMMARLDKATVGAGWMQMQASLEDAVDIRIRRGRTNTSPEVPTIVGRPDKHPRRSGPPPLHRVGGGKPARSLFKWGWGSIGLQVPVS
jgi:hypothetical protein